jgi:hypothetical protein
MSLDLILEQVELMDNIENDNTFDIFFDLNTSEFHAFENNADKPRTFKYDLVDTMDSIIAKHKDEILNYCFGDNYSKTYSVSLGDIFLHRKHIKRVD